MIRIIFNIVSDVLDYFGRITKLTYNEINIIVYFFVIPFTWLCLLDMIFKFHYLKMAFITFTLGFMVGCRDFKNYSDRLFEKSASFLSIFNKYGGNYISASVWICVLVPMVVYFILIYFVLKK